MEVHTIDRTDERPLKFTGELIAMVDNCWGPDGRRNRWLELALYQTQKGRYIAVQTRYTCWQGERDFTQANVCDTKHDVVGFFGWSTLAKELYAKAGIEAPEEVE